MNNPNYGNELAALSFTLDGIPEGAQPFLEELSLRELNKLAEKLDELAALVDDEALTRSEGEV